MRTYAIYHDINKRQNYFSDGSLVGLNTVPYIKYKETIQLELHYVTDADLTAYTGFAGETIFSSAAVDNDFDHYYTGTLVGNTSGTVVAISVDIGTDTPASTGYVQLTNGAGESESVAYTAKAQNSDNTWTFTVSDTLTYSYLDGDVAKVTEPLLIKSTTIDDTNKATGIFVITLDANTQAFRDAAEGFAKINTQCVFEHQVFDDTATLILSSQMYIECQNLLDDDGAIPPAPDDDYYNKTETDALIAGAKNLANATTSELDHQKFLRPDGAGGATFDYVELAWLRSENIDDSSPGTHLAEGTVVVADGSGLVKEVALLDASDNILAARLGNVEAGNLSTHDVTDSALPNLTDGTAFFADGSGVMRTLATIDSNDIIIIDSYADYLGSATYKSVQDAFLTLQSTGWISGGGITDDGDGTITVAAGTGLLRTSNSSTADLKFCDWSAESGANVDLVDNDTNYIYIEYNSGTPRAVASTTDPSTTDCNTNIMLGLVYREGTTLHIVDSYKLRSGDAISYVNRRLCEVGGWTHASGASPAETGTRNFSITAGVFWRGLNRVTTNAFDSQDSADTFTYYYRDGASIPGWTAVTGQSQIDNLQYDDGSGVLATLNNNEYGVHWVYLGMDDEVYVIYGQGTYTLTQAEDADPPSTLPDEVDSHSVLAAKIIIAKSASTFTAVFSAFEASYSSATPTDHNDLSNIQGGTSAQYYHLTSAQHTSVTGVTASEYSQLANIDATTISAAQWGYIGAMDQGLATTNSPTFAGLNATTSGASTPAIIEGNVDDDTSQVYYELTRSGGATYDTSWFMYIPSSTTDLRWYNSADRMTLTAPGNVLIGTSSEPTPASRLVVKGSTADGSTDVISGQDSGGNEVFAVDTDGNTTVGGTLSIDDDVSSASVSPLNVMERSTPPTAPQEQDIYLDDGSNTASGLPGWRRYAGSAGWEDIGSTLSGGTLQGTDQTYDIRPTNEGTTGSNTRGEYSVDLQTDRGLTTQVASGTHTAVIAGAQNTASANYSATIGGLTNTASALNAMIGGGRSNTASGSYSAIIGSYYAVASHYGEQAHASGRFAAAGDCQNGRVQLRTSTSSTSEAELGLDGSTSYFTLADNDAYACTITLLAAQADGSTGRWKREVNITRQGSTTAIDGVVSTLGTDHESANVGAPTISIAADDSNEALSIKVTPANTTATRWTALVEYVKINY